MANKGNLLKMGYQLLFKELSRTTVAGPAKREEERSDLLQIRAPHGLIKVGQQGLRGVSIPRKT